MLGKVKALNPIGILSPGTSTVSISTVDLVNGIYTIKLSLNSENNKISYVYKVVINKR